MGFGKILGLAVLGVGAIAAAPFTGGGSILGAATIAGSLAGAGTIAAAAGAGAVGAGVGYALSRKEEEEEQEAHFLPCSWMGDAQLSAAESMRNFFSPSYYTNFVQLINDNQDMVSEDW